MTICRGFLKIILVFLGAALLGACASISAYKETPRVSLVSIEPKDMTLLEQRFGIRLRIMNPNDIPIPIEGLSYALEVNGREFAYGVSRQDVSIPAYGETTLDVEVVSSFLKVIQQFQQMEGAEGGSLNYRLSGKIGLANSPASLPFDYQGELTYLSSEKSAPASTD
jgi:LEA14-like dessication related protein